MQSTNINGSSRTVKFPVFDYLALYAPIALVIIIAGFTIVFFRTEAQIRSLIDEDNLRLQHISGFIGANMSSTFNHLQSVLNESETQKALNSNDPEVIRAFEKSLLILSRRNPIYEQVRWIDEKGLERIRISRGQHGPYIEPSQNLQDKNQRYYFEAAKSLPAGELYASKIDLNVERGVIELPLKPVLRIATPLVDLQGGRRGIIIINILMTPIFTAVQFLEQPGNVSNYLLLNQQGELLHGTVKKPGWRESDGKITSFSTTYPAVWKNISTTETGHLELGDEIWTWKSVSSFDNLIEFKPYNSKVDIDIEKRIAGEFSLIFVAQRPLNFMLVMRRNIRVSSFIGVLVALFVYAVSLFFYLNGNFRARRAELEATYAMAHATNMTRLKELEERFRRLVESSSVGQLVVDSSGEIEISNATVEEMLGYRKNELIGCKVETLLPTGKQQAHLALREEFMTNPRPRKMGEGRKLEALRKDGTTIPVEVGLNPYTDEGRKLVLVNVIELSIQKT